MRGTPKNAFTRGARLASVPLGHAGRTALSVGKRLGGAPAETVSREVAARTAEHLFRALGDMKGGAMKFGQAFSVLEAAFGEEDTAAYREQLVALQDSAPPMLTSTVREQIAAALGENWREQLVWLDGGPTAAASIGQVHRGRWHDGREVAVKVQYPHAAAAMAADMRTITRITKTLAPLMPGIDVAALGEELASRFLEELDYASEAHNQRSMAAGFADHPDIVVPGVVAAAGGVLITEWMDSTAPLSLLCRRPEDYPPSVRDHYGTLYAQAMFAGPALVGMLHADPHPGNFRLDAHRPGHDAPILATNTDTGRDSEPPELTCGRLGMLDFGAVGHLPGGFPPVLTEMIAAAIAGDGDQLEAVLRAHHFIRPGITVEKQALLDHLRPLAEPAATDTFRFSRAWMREAIGASADPRSQEFTTATKINLPADYLLIHRAWIGTIGVLCQMNAEVPLRSLLTRHVPGFDS